MAPTIRISVTVADNQNNARVEWNDNGRDSAMVQVDGCTVQCQARALDLLYLALAQIFGKKETDAT